MDAPWRAAQENLFTAILESLFYFRPWDYAGESSLEPYTVRQSGEAQIVVVLGHGDNSDGEL
jgi:hypothetical protein